MQRPVGWIRCSGGVSLDLRRLTYSTWHFEAAATQTVSADPIQYQKNSSLSSLSKLLFFFFALASVRSVDLTCPRAISMHSDAAFSSEAGFFFPRSWMSALFAMYSLITGDLGSV